MRPLRGPPGARAPRAAPPAPGPRTKLGLDADGVETQPPLESRGGLEPVHGGLLEHGELGEQEGDDRALLHGERLRLVVPLDARALRRRRVRLVDELVELRVGVADAVEARLAVE